MVGLGCALEVSLYADPFLLPHEGIDKFLEDFTLMEASCVIVKILQTSPNVRLPDGVIAKPTGQEQQTLGILITSAEGCKVRLD